GSSQALVVYGILRTMPTSRHCSGWHLMSGSNTSEMRGLEPPISLCPSGCYPIFPRHRCKVVGPVGLEPTTKGFTVTRRFRREWTISSPASCLGGVRDALACHQEH